MQKRWILVLAVGFAALLAPAVAHAGSATACFDWNCVAGTCTFDGSCSSATPYIWKYNWTFGDGTGTGLTSQSDPTHVYTACWPTVQLLVANFEGDYDTVSCEISTEYGGCPGPPHGATSGRCQ